MIITLGISGYIVALYGGFSAYTNYKLSKTTPFLQDRSNQDTKTNTSTIRAEGIPILRKVEIPDNIDNETIEHFVRVLETKTSDKTSLYSLQENLKTLKLKKLKYTYIRDNIKEFKNVVKAKIKNEKYYPEYKPVLNLIKAGSYSEILNDIEIHNTNKKNIAFYHELLHMASSRHDSNGATYCGFCNMLYDQKERTYLDFGDGINEGMTEHLARKYFGGFNDPLEAYPIEVEITRLISTLADDDFMEQCYFNADIKSVIEKLESYMQNNNYGNELAKKLIFNLDYINKSEFSFALISFLTPKNKKNITTLFSEMGEILYTLYENKILKEVKDSKKAFELINNYAERMMKVSKKTASPYAVLLSKQNYLIHLEALKLKIIDREKGIKRNDQVVDDHFIKEEKHSKKDKINLDSVRNIQMENMQVIESTLDRNIRYNPEIYKKCFFSLRFQNERERLTVFRKLFSGDTAYNPKYYHLTVEDEKKLNIQVDSKTYSNPLLTMFYNNKNLLQRYFTQMKFEDDNERIEVFQIVFGLNKCYDPAFMRLTAEDEERIEKAQGRAI